MISRSPVGQRGKHLDKHAPKRFRLEAFNRCGFVEGVRVDQQSDALFAPLLERRHVQGLVRSGHLRT